MATLTETHRTAYRAESAWFASLTYADGQTDRIMVTGPADVSPVHNSMTYGERAGYDARCSMCWLGYGHSDALHASRIAA